MIGDLAYAAGALALFLYGMKVMSDGIQKSAGDRLHAAMNLMTVNPATAVFTGFAITAVVQSSSATTVMVVGFVNAGLFSLRQAIGVIMGANIGTTVTGWLVALLGFKVDVSAVSLPAIAVGLVFLFSRKLDHEEWGEAIIGFGLLFLGLEFLKDSVPDIKSHPEYLEFVSRLTGRGLASYVLFVLIGGLLTVVVQSSSAAMATTLTMAHAGWIDLPTAAAIVLGENIGTTVTANLAAIRTDLNARRSARVHFLFNVFGVIWMAPVFAPFLSLVDRIVPGPSASVEGIAAHLAMFHTLFNVTNTLIFIWFIPQLARLAETLVRHDGAETGHYRLPYIATALQDTPEINIVKAEREVSKMAAIAEEMFAIFLTVFERPKEKLGKEVKRLKKLEELTDEMREEISRFLVQCIRENMTGESADRVQALIRVTSELERIGDNCFNLITLAQRRYDKKIKIRGKAMAEIEPYTSLVAEFLQFITGLVDADQTSEVLERALKMEKKVNRFRDSLKASATKRMARGGQVKAELLYIDILRHVEQIGDHALNVVQALPRHRLISPSRGD